MKQIENSYHAGTKVEQNKNEVKKGKSNMSWHTVATKKGNKLWLAIKDQRWLVPNYNLSTTTEGIRQENRISSNPFQSNLEGIKLTIGIIRIGVLVTAGSLLVIPDGQLWGRQG